MHRQTEENGLIQRTIQSIEMGLADAYIGLSMWSDMHIQNLFN